ncbi:MAG TPA: DUF4230 domain-containing protein [Candidatus Mcinerneyibacteriales bacterium]|mgnify:FL=1|nr:DUF4230 domain-containing protein [Candidatus Mcinerneyibacteriales bacterium]HPJ70376.1 DUF4230 domain-containing protein [Candidatus Mcinerneyibacteriales bacterium]
MGKIKTAVIIIELVVIVLLLAYIVHLKSVPAPTEEEKIINTLIINDIKEILKLAVLEVNVSDIVESRKEKFVNILSFPVYIGNKEMDLLVRGKMTVGFDLKKMEEEDFLLNRTDKTITVTLPAPELIATDIDYRFMNESKTFWLSISEEERNQIMAFGKARLYRIARDKRILDKAEFSGVDTIQAYLEKLFPGYSISMIVTAKEEV